MAKQDRGVQAGGGEAGPAPGAAALPLSAQVREKRRAAGLSQQELAERCGVKQSAISGFERHGLEAQALSAEKLRQVADLLGIAVDDAHLASRPVAPRLSLFYCPNGDCPSALVYPLGAQTAYRPRFIRAETGTRLFCPDCGEVCEVRCPACQASVSERLRGAFCPECGSPYVSGDELAAQEVAGREARRAALEAAVAATEYRRSRERGAGSDGGR